MEITELLARARGGEPERLAQVFEALYPELRRIAQGRPGEGSTTLTPTVLVHEAFLRLTENRELALSDRRHFFACAARAMRCIVLDHARRRHAGKRGGGLAPVTLDEHLPVGEDVGDSDVFALDQALDALDQVNPRQRPASPCAFMCSSARTGTRGRAPTRAWPCARRIRATGRSRRR